MKLIRVQIQKLRNHFYIRLPKIIVDRYNMNDGDELEISLHSKSTFSQVDLWEQPPQEINRILFFIPNDTQSINMYNRIYVPEKFRFFFPTNKQDFLLITNVGNIKTHVTVNGYFTKGLRQWFYINGPLMPGDKIKINIYDETSYQYELIYIKNVLTILLIQINWSKIK